MRMDVPGAPEPSSKNDTSNSGTSAPLPTPRSASNTYPVNRLTKTTSFCAVLIYYEFAVLLCTQLHVFLAVYLGHCGDPV